MLLPAITLKSPPLPKDKSKSLVNFKSEPSCFSKYDNELVDGISFVCGAEPNPNTDGAGIKIVSPGFNIPTVSDVGSCVI